MIQLYTQLRFASCLIMFLGAIAIAKTPILTPETVVEMKTVDQVVMQPQGNYIAYTLRVQRDSNEAPGGSYHELWVVSRRTGEAHAYIRKPYSVSAISWTPDGQHITFLNLRETLNPFTQVYSIRLKGGEARPLSHAPRNISKYALSPNGKFLAYTMLEELPQKVTEAHQQGFDETIADHWFTLTRLYVEDLSNGKSHLVTEDKLNIWNFRWSYDSQQLLYLASKRPFTDDSYMFCDNYIVSAKGGAGKLIHDTEGKLRTAQMSPNGEYIAWLGTVSFNDPYPGSLYILPKKGGSPKNLLKDFKGTAQSFVWKNSKTILLVAYHNTRSHLYQISAANGRMKRLTRDRGAVFRDISLSQNGKWYAMAANAYNHPNEVFVGSISKKSLTRVTYSNPNFKQMSFGQQSSISWKGPDHLTVYGVLIKPVGYQSGKKYPLQVQVHGGPESVRLDGWNTSYSRPGQMLAQRGYMVLYPNYRGSIGRGVAYSKGDHRDLMGKEFEDILTGIDYLAKQGMIDPKRVGIGGGSYGGYTSAWAATKHSQRFKASVVFVGISNQISKAGMTDIPAENASVHWDLWLYDHFDLVWDRSPLKHIKNAQTPTLILHGQEDKRVPLNQAYELYRGLKYMKVPTQLVTYPREGHGNKERAHQIDLCRRTLHWYDQYLKKAITQ